MVKLTQIVASHTAVVVVVDNIVAEYVMVESGMGLVSAVRRGVGLSLDRGRAGDAGPKVGTARRRHSHSLPPPSYDLIQCNIQPASLFPPQFHFLR